MTENLQSLDLSAVPILSQENPVTGPVQSNLSGYLLTIFTAKYKDSKQGFFYVLFHKHILSKIKTYFSGLRGYQVALLHLFEGQ